MSASVDVRLLGPGDEATFTRVALAYRGSDLDGPYARAWLADRRNLALAALDGADPVGCVVAYTLDRLDGARMLLVYEVAVLEAWRRRGIGRALVDRAIDIARERGCGKMWLRTETTNHPARALYEAAGGVPGQDDQLYWWNL